MSAPVVGTGRRLGAAVRRQRAVLAVIGFCVVVVVVLGVLSAGSSGRGALLDPENPGPDGAQAVARVLQRHGVEVDVVRRAAGLDRADLDRDTTLMVTSTGELGTTTARDVRRLGGGAGAVVLAAPVSTLSTLGLPLTPARPRPLRSTSARCEDDLLSGLTVEVRSGLGYRPEGGADVLGCFPDRARRPVLLVARVGATVPTYAVGPTDVFSNQRIQQGDNAALAVRLLGQHDRLVWYVPDHLDVPSGDTGSTDAQLPRGLGPSLWLLLAAVVATMLWRGRRLGPLVVERLPVRVRAVESTQGRGRLYRRVRDQAHAAAVLREATRRRLLGRLRLPGGTGTDALVRAIVETTGGDPATVHDLLVTRPVPDDGALTRLAADLAALEREVHDA